MNGHLLEILAREKVGMPEAWQVFKWEVLPKDEPFYYEMTGVVASFDLLGNTDWDSADRATEKRVRLTFEAATQMADEWSKRTGQCINCTGSGKTLKRWSADTGTEYKPCVKCNGTGKAA